MFILKRLTDVQNTLYGQNKNINTKYREMAFIFSVFPKRSQSKKAQIANLEPDRELTHDCHFQHDLHT